mmetsp:Transcript_22778/g.71373  ORF Transcript_22778/g.71373 Transcript_22778/m.71373 type:complete len:110 (-) Transcript_22778:1231-1560(-)
MKVSLALLALATGAAALAPSRRDMFEIMKVAAAGSTAAIAAPAFATYTGKPTEAPPKIEAKTFNTLYPEKKLTLDKKSPVDRLDLAPPTFQTYTKTYPGLTTAFGNPPK